MKILTSQFQAFCMLFGNHDNYDMTRHILQVINTYPTITE